MHVKLTKNELRLQQVKLAQLRRYLPTLQLKKAMLQAEVNEVRLAIARMVAKLDAERAKVGGYAEVLTVQTSLDFSSVGKLERVEKVYENIAGVEVPTLRNVHFAALEYSLFDTPPWAEIVIDSLRGLVKIQVEVTVLQEKAQALEKEFREVSIRVNLFEKRLIPQAAAAIKKIKIFLGDIQLASVAQAKVAKTKILEKKAVCA